MDIVGIGTEIVECLRIGRMIESHGERFLTQAGSARNLAAEDARLQRRGELVYRRGHGETAASRTIPIATSWRSSSTATEGPTIAWIHLTSNWIHL